MKTKINSSFICFLSLWAFIFIYANVYDNRWFAWVKHIF
jgi:hypothetical protein